MPILSRLLVRVAILAASLAWAGFVFTQTIGDPGRGERIASAVLADDAARAEVTVPITSAVMSTTGLPAEQEPLVAGQVERLLQDPSGARTFIDPFAGSWARMLGEDDRRPAEFDLVPLLDQLSSAIPGMADAPVEQLAVTAVPLPRTSLDWMGGVRDAISVSLLPLALVAFGSFLAAFLIGDRRRVLRRFAVWAVAAGLVWVVVPPILVAAARRWAPGADEVAAVSLGEATAGLLPVAIVLVVAGVVAFMASFAVAPAGAASSAPRRPDPHRAVPAHEAAHPLPQHAATRAMPPVAPSDHIAVAPTTQVMRQSDRDPVDRTAPMPVVTPTHPVAAADQAVDGERDALWDYYGTS